jgi:ribosomal protein S12
MPTRGAAATSRSVVFRWRLSICANIQPRSRRMASVALPSRRGAVALPSEDALEVARGSLSRYRPIRTWPRWGRGGRGNPSRPCPQERPVGTMSPFPSRRPPNSALRLCTLLKLLPNAAVCHIGPCFPRSVTAMASLCPPIPQCSLR